VDDVNLMVKNTHMVYINTGALLAARKVVGLEVNVDKVKHIYIYIYMSVYRGKNVGQNDKVKVGNKSFDNVTKVNTLGTTLNMKMLFTKEEQADSIQEIHATIRSIIYHDFPFSVHIPRTTTTLKHFQKIGRAHV
jgi:hypothetical protein